MQPRLVEPSAEAIDYVIAHLRAADREELEATNYDVDAQLPERLKQVMAYQHVWEVGGRPASILGAWPMWPGVWVVYAMGTDDFPARAMTKHIRRCMVPAIIEAGGHRAECASIATHTTAHRWLEGLGAKRESEMPGYGRDGQTFYRYVWTLEHVR